MEQITNRAAITITPTKEFYKALSKSTGKKVKEPKGEIDVGHIYFVPFHPDFVFDLSGF